MEGLGDLGTGLGQHDREGVDGPGAVVADPLEQVEGAVLHEHLAVGGQLLQRLAARGLQVAAEGAEEVLVDDDVDRGVGLTHGDAVLAAAGGGGGHVRGVVGGLHEEERRTHDERHRDPATHGEAVAALRVPDSLL